MRKFLSKVKPVICMLLCIALLVTVACVSLGGKESGAEKDVRPVLKVWQIDSFEGGRGSRADFLQNVGDDYSNNDGCFVSVTSLSADAARLNLKAGNIPDLISYGAGFYGLENCISGYKCWCSGSYCLLTLDTNSDFPDVNAENTVINGGKDNLAAAAALFLGLQTAKIQKATGAYVELINGGYKYLLGTQRDVYRLKTRQVAFSVKPVTVFNDLYQNISVTSACTEARYAEGFIDYLLKRGGEVTKLGLLTGGTVYDDEMKAFSGLQYEYRLISPVSTDTRNELRNLISAGDINMLKNLLK